MRKVQPIQHLDLPFLITEVMFNGGGVIGLQKWSWIFDPRHGSADFNMKHENLDSGLTVKENEARKKIVVETALTSR